MTAISAALASHPGAHLAPRALPTRAERLLLSLTHAVEAAMIRRLQRRACAPVAPGTDAVEDRRTAQALGAVGILPR
ncbi:hypothetical protein [Microbacterium sp. T2.11-28]|uniref:hypothetical protein n=1 Tax=unclassified Microbacterium TaxID=2609290 RepID=UPI002477B0EF|nr:hypothetical protein [Microbacterium sp. T2.11-28]CAI9386234.1 hypothetical protein MICABA_00261 [Microbacterium sp. T2.11-28]